MTQNEIALKILNMGKDGYKNDAEGFEKLNQANDLIEKHVNEQLRLNDVSNRRELLIDLLTSLEKGGGNRFVSKEWIADNYLQGN
tara:strand:+ start:327 stop:581 length:255 start_codon:yes stop_codon:yes gene_type:complete